VRRAQDWLSQQPLIVDTETTGLEAYDEIVQVAVVDANGNVLLNTLSRPSRSIPMRATRIHGIGNELVREAPDGGEVCGRLRALLSGRLVCAYNAGFDQRMLEQTARVWRCRPPVFRAQCVMELYAEFAGQPHHHGMTYRWWSLRDAAAACGIPNDRAHDALSDARATAALLHHIAAQALRPLPARG
jgi:DNA polymerase III epsilon subunit-like protein